MGAIENYFVTDIGNLSETEKYVFYYLDEHPNLVKKLTLSEIAEKLNTSNTTIIRMTKKLGLDGFSNFKYLVERIVSDTQIVPQKDLAERYRSYLDAVITGTDLDKLTYIAQKIHGASTLYVAGVGITKPIAEYVAKRFLQLNKSTLYTYESHLIELMPTFTKKDDIVLFLSMSGETKTIIQAAKKMNYVERVDLFSITNNGNSTLAKLTDVTLSSSMPTNIYENYDITSRSALMLQADLLIETYLGLYF